MLACRDDLRIKTVAREKTDIIPEVSSTVEINSDPTGQIKAEAREGVTQYGARILDASCGNMVHDLGVQANPEFSLPADAYFQALCLETTYYDRFGKTVDVKLQPITLEGPEAIEIVMSRDNQVLDFPDVLDASSYTYLITDANGAIKLSASNLTESYIDLKNQLATGEYKMVILAQNAEGKNLKAITYKLDVILTGPITNVSLNLKFERQYYQTRSVKRLLIEQSVLDKEVELTIGGIAIEPFQIPTYTGGFGALMDSVDAFMRNSLPYGLETVSVNLPGLTESASDIPVTVRDFTVFAPMPAAFADGSYAKDGLEAWSSPLQTNLVKSGDNELTSTFGLMIIQ